MYIITDEEIEIVSKILGYDSQTIRWVKDRPLSDHDAEIAKKERERVLDDLFIWCHNEQMGYDTELKRLSKLSPHLKDKCLCLATDSSMCGQFMDKIESLRGDGYHEHLARGGEP